MFFSHTHTLCICGPPRTISPCTCIYSMGMARIQSHTNTSSCPETTKTSNSWCCSVHCKSHSFGLGHCLCHCLAFQFQLFLPALFSSSSPIFTCWERSIRMLFFSQYSFDSSVRFESSLSMRVWNTNYRNPATTLKKIVRVAQFGKKCQKRCHQFGWRGEFVIWNRVINIRKHAQICTNANSINICVIFLLRATWWQSILCLFTNWA